MWMLVLQQLQMIVLCQKFCLTYCNIYYAFPSVTRHLTQFFFNHTYIMSAYGIVRNKIMDSLLKINYCWRADDQLRVKCFISLLLGTQLVYITP